MDDLRFYIWDYDNNCAKPIRDETPEDVSTELGITTDMVETLVRHEEALVKIISKLESKIERLENG